MRTTLDVDYIIEGSVQIHGDQARLSVQLVEMDTGLGAWGRTIDRTITNPLSDQDAMASSIIDDVRHVLVVGRFGQMQDQLGPELSTKFAKSAYELGLEELDALDTQNYRRDRAYFEAAIAADPEFASAYFQLAFTYLDELAG